MFSVNPASNAASQYLVFRAEDTHSAELAWEKRIVELAEGRPVKEIIQVLYREQLSRGARLVDVGIWKSLFDRTVVNTICDLVDRRVIRMKLNFFYNANRIDIREKESNVDYSKEKRGQPHSWEGSRKNDAESKDWTGHRPTLSMQREGHITGSGATEVGSRFTNSGVWRASKDPGQGTVKPGRAQ